MSSRLDQALGLPMQGLKLFEARSQVIANNLANADTPGYSARDIDFREILRQQTGPAQGGHAKLQPNLQPGPGGDFGPTVPAAGSLPLSGSAYPLKYRVAGQNAADNNSVEEATEKAAFAENTIRYQATLRFLDGRIQSIQSAIKGE